MTVKYGINQKVLLIQMKLITLLKILPEYFDDSPSKSSIFTTSVWYVPYKNDFVILK